MPLIVIRQIPNLRPVTHCIVKESTDAAIVDQEHYLNSIAEEAIKEFKAKFPEFKDASFYKDYIPQHEVL